MSEITKGDLKPGQPNDHLTDKDTGTQHGIPAGATQADSPGGYGSGDRLATETAVHPEGGKDQAKDI